MCIFFYLQNKGFISDDFGQVSNEKSVMETTNNIGTICSYTCNFFWLVWFEHILLNILSKGLGTSSQTYFAL